jgi:hypothetical protein
MEKACPGEVLGRFFKTGGEGGIELGGAALSPACVLVYRRSCGPPPEFSKKKPPILGDGPTLG